MVDVRLLPTEVIGGDFLAEIRTGLKSWVESDRDSSHASQQRGEIDSEAFVKAVAYMVA